MIKLNGVEIKLDKYPDGTFLFKDIPPIGGWCRDNIEWFFESMEELTAVEYITRYCWDHRVVPNLYMPYIPDARMDRVKHENELFTLKYFAQTINSLHFGKVEVLDPHSDVSAALFNKVHVESPNRMIEDAVKKIASNNLIQLGKGCCCIYYDDNGELQCEDGYDSIFGNGTLRTVFVDGEACNKETFEDIRERLNGGNKKTKISKITDYLLKDDVIVVMDVDGVLAPYEFSELSHSMTDDEWDKLVASGESPYKDVRPIKLMQKFIQKKGIDKVYTCSKSPSSEIPGKRAFIKNNYNLPDDNIYFTLEKTEKLTVLQTLQQKLGLKPSQIAIVEDTVKTLDYIRAHSDFVTVHVSSFME